MIAKKDELLTGSFFTESVDPLLLEYVPQALIILDQNSLIKYANQSALTIFETNERDIFNTSLVSYLSKGDGRPLSKVTRWNCKSSFRCIYKNKAQQELTLDLASKLMPKTNGNFYVVTLNDVTDYVRREKMLYHQASYDPLTNILNRRRFFELFDKEMFRAKRFQKPFSLLVFDIDHFKAINDQFGHSVGDNVLKIISDVSQEILRKVDVFGRIGGEEFAVLLPETCMEETLVVSERLRETIKNIPMAASGASFNITVSIGVTAWTSLIGTAMEIFNAADQALYEAKRNGRDSVRTCFWHERSNFSRIEPSTVH